MRRRVTGWPDFISNEAYPASPSAAVAYDDDDVPPEWGVNWLISVAATASPTSVIPITFGARRLTDGPRSQAPPPAIAGGVGLRGIRGRVRVGDLLEPRRQIVEGLGVQRPPGVAGKERGPVVDAPTLTERQQSGLEAQTNSFSERAARLGRVGLPRELLRAFPGAAPEHAGSTNGRVQPSHHPSRAEPGGRQHDSPPPRARTRPGRPGRPTRASR